MAHNSEKPDFSPLVEGSKEYNQAVQARKEMLGWLAKADNSYDAPVLGDPIDYPRAKRPTIGDLTLGKWASEH